MNAGMFGMGDGRGMAGRKLIGRAVSGGGFITLVNPAGSLANLFGQAGASIFLPANVRTLALSVNGSGALRACALHAPSSGVSNMTAEVVLDGVRVINAYRPTVDGATSSGIAAVGNTQSDFLPFTNSCEIYYTSSVGGTCTNFILVDIYQ